jgi:hypothetical protein
MAAKRIESVARANSVTFFGGVVGLMVFLVVGLLPSLLYGGYAGVMLGSALFGTPIHEHVLAQATVVLGVLFGLLATGAVFVLGGAIMASGLYGTVMAVMPEAEAKEEAEPKRPKPAQARPVEAQTAAAAAE